MGPVFSIAAKEIRALFQSQIAVLFLVLFEITTLFSFFVLSKFFARNLADLNPFFESLPLQLILLVSAISMRAWAEERKSGTLEVLLTLPVRSFDLVLGKFLAGMTLVGLALLFTLPLPITVSLLGPLDWGPVVGGYLGALLLASAYLAIGLCISARTDNQVLALMSTIAIGGLLYLVGTEQVQSLLGVSAGEAVSRIGSGSRFESIARGVLDVRDLAYYASLTVFFLVLNKYFLDRRRIDAHGAGQVRLFSLQTLVALVALNCIAVNVWMQPTRVGRIDLTENQDYSISDTTRSMLADLDAPLTIIGIFSERSHPKLQPRVPQLRAVLHEYGFAAPDQVTVQIVDPSTDDDLANQLEEEYGIRPVPMPVADRNETRIVNSWFHVLLKLGDQHAVVTFNDLIEVDSADGQIDVRLKDPEYDISKAIRRVSQDFVSLESLVAKLPETRLALYATEDTLDPTNLQNLDRIRKLGRELAEQSDAVVFEEVDPRSDPTLAESIAQKYGVQPTLSLTNGGQLYYLHLVVETGDQAQRIFPRGEMSESDLENTLEAAFKRIVPGQLKTIAIYTEDPPAPPPQQGQRQPPPPRDYQILKALLGQRMEVVDTDLDKGTVPPEVDVLVVGKTGELPPHKQMAIEQFLLRGGSVIALAGRNRAEFDRGFRRVPEDPGLFAMLEKWGVKVAPSMVLDAQSGELALPVGRRTVQFAYPYWIDLRAPQLNQEHLAMGGLNQVSMPWASPITLQGVPEALATEELLHSTEQSWLRDSDDLMPDFQLHPETGFAAPTDPGAHLLGVTLVGRFPPFFTEGTRPQLEGALTEPVAEGRLVVLGSSELASDLLLDYARRSPVGRLHLANDLLVQNLVDWSLEDTDLLAIRSPGNFSRQLVPMDADTLFQIEMANYLLVLLPLPLLYLWSRRRRKVPVIAGGAA